MKWCKWLLPAFSQCSFESEFPEILLQNLKFSYRWPSMPGNFKLTHFGIFLFNTPLNTSLPIVDMVGMTWRHRHPHRQPALLRQPHRVRQLPDLRGLYRVVVSSNLWKSSALQRPVPLWVHHCTVVLRDLFINVVNQYRLYTKIYFLFEKNWPNIAPQSVWLFWYHEYDVSG